MDDVDVLLDRLDAAMTEIRGLGLDDPAELEREADLVDEMNDLVRVLAGVPLRREHLRRLRRVLAQTHDREVAHARHTLDDDVRRLLGGQPPQP